MSVIKTVTISFEPSATILSGDFIDIGIQTNSSEGFLKETFRIVRSSSNQVTIGEDSAINASNFETALNLDGSLFYIETSRFGNGVTISFTNDTYYFTTVTGSLIDNNKVIVTTTQGEEVTEKTLTFNSYTSFISDVCTKANAIIDATGGNGIYDVYVDNVLTLQNQTTPITIPLNRGLGNVVRVTSQNEDIGSVLLKVPRKLSTSDINFMVTNLSSGTNIQATVSFISPYVSPYEYSLDGITYQESNVFTNLANGDYNFYVKDALGCAISKLININSITKVVETIFDISDINPIRYSKYNVGKKNYKNTLSCNDLRLISTQFNHLYLDTDIIGTQFKTNAQYINVFTLDANLNKNTLTAFKQTSNTGLQAKSTCTYFDLGNDRSGIYFGLVDLLNPINNDVIGNANFGFILPEWANKEGKYVVIDGIGEVAIDSIGYSDFYESFIIEFNIPYNGSPIEKTLFSEYNLQPYEVYEFNTIMSNEQERFNIVIEVGTDANNIDFTYISESVRKVEDSEFLFDIDYWGEKNVGRFVYQTGIKNKIRINGLVDYIGEQATEGYDGDSEYYVTDNTIYHSERFSFFRISSQVAHNLRLVFASEELEINGISYKLAEPPEISQSDGNANLKNFFVTLKSSGNLILEDVSEQISENSSNLEFEYLIGINKNKGSLLWTKTV